jgi:hypothetical protein
MKNTRLLLSTAVALCAASLPINVHDLRIEKQPEFPEWKPNYKSTFRAKGKRRRDPNRWR